LFRFFGSIPDILHKYSVENGRLKEIEEEKLSAGKLRILVAGVRVPTSKFDIQDVVAVIKASKHEVDSCIVDVGQSGKFTNINRAINNAPRPMSDYDYLIITDDDVHLPENFLNRYLSAVQHFDLDISQPAHAWRSYVSYSITRCRFGVMARRTNFVEIGPLTVLSAKCFDALLPFPETRYGWGLDLLWSDIAEKANLKMGIVDALPLRHLRPVGANYDRGKASLEANDMLNSAGVSRRFGDVIKTIEYLR
jgi:hypothetical protein